jgi:hypothetical protein
VSAIFISSCQRHLYLKLSAPSLYPAVIAILSKLPTPSPIYCTSQAVSAIFITSFHRHFYLKLPEPSSSQTNFSSFLLQCSVGDSYRPFDVAPISSFNFPQIFTPFVASCTKCAFFSQISFAEACTVQSA